MKIPENLKWKKTGKTLGQGGQGQVFEVQDVTSKNGLTYAMKALSKNRPSKAYERFHREIKAIASLRHPYIIKIADFSSLEDDFQYYVMEIVQGAVPLQTILKSSDNPYLRNPIKSMKLFRQICEALLACEESEPCIVHRDLSPANVLIVPDGSIKIIDFGLCQIED
jgi:serine/threonine protein kinase